MLINAISRMMTSCSMYVKLADRLQLP
jgi:hypothetical protein